MAWKVKIPIGGRSSLPGTVWNAKFIASVTSIPNSATQAWEENSSLEVDSPSFSISKFSLEKMLFKESLFSIKVGYKESWNLSLKASALLSWEINALFIKFAELPPIKPIICDLS